MLITSRSSVQVRPSTPCLQTQRQSRKRSTSHINAARMRPVCGASVDIGDGAAQVQEKLDEALQQVQEAQEEIVRHREAGREEAEQIRKDQRFQRAKGALDLKEKGHKLEPAAGHDQPDASLEESKEAQTRENASSQDAQVPDPSISKSVCERLQALEALRATKPFRKLVSRGEPVPQLTHHYAAAAWWAVVG